MKQTKKLTEKLRGMYEEYKAGLIPTSRLAKHLSAPLLLQPPDDWSHAEHRVLVVGQETLGWGVDAGEIGNEKYGPINTLSEFIAEDCSVDALLAQYSKFAFGDKYKYSGSPFWSAFRQLGPTSVEGSAITKNSVLWSNIFRMDFHKKGCKGGSVYKNTESWDEFFEIQELGLGLLNICIYPRTRTYCIAPRVHQQNNLPL